MDIDNISGMFSGDPYGSPVYRFIKGDNTYDYVALEGNIREFPRLDIKYFVYAVMRDDLPNIVSPKHSNNKRICCVA